MGHFVRDLYGFLPNPTDFIRSNTGTDLRVGTVVMREATLTDAGEVDIATTTAALNAFGCAEDVDVYSATQGDAQAMIRTIPTPFAVWKFRISGTSVRAAALATATPAQILTNDTASAGGTLITDTAVGTINMEGGLIKGRTGANAGSIRKIAAHTNDTSTAVTVPFPNAIAVNDTFIRVPWCRGAVGVQMVATTIDEANGAIASGTGIPFNVEEVIIDESDDVAFVLGCFRTHFYNALA